MKRLETFKGFMNLTAQRKCPPGFKFDDTLKVCVPKFPRSSSYYGGFGHSHSKTIMAMAITVMVTAMATATGQVMATEAMVAMAETVAANEDF